MDRTERGPSLLADTIAAHGLRFTRPLAPAHADAAGLRMLAAFALVALGLLVGLRQIAALLDVRGHAVSGPAIVAVLMAGFFWLHHAWVRLPFAAIALRAPSDWTRREVLYLAQVVPVAAVLFAILFRSHLQALWLAHGALGFLLVSVSTGLAWGAVQEFLYRGWLQTELARRFGAVAGLLLANLLFTVGPLHLDYLTDPAGIRWAGLAAVFGIGLLFGLIYQRSGNLWLPAVLHGLWPLNMN